MSTNKKIGLIFLVTIVFPIIIPILFNCFEMGKYFYGYICPAWSFGVFSLIPLLGAIIMLQYNYKSGLKSKTWFSVSIAVIIISCLYLYSLYSLSHFGF